MFLITAEPLNHVNYLDNYLLTFEYNVSEIWHKTGKLDKPYYKNLKQILNYINL